MDAAGNVTGTGSLSRRRWSAPGRLWIVLLIALLTPSASAQEPDRPEEDLRRIESEMDAARERRAALEAEATAAAAELAELRQRSITAAEEILESQRELDDLEAEVAALEAEAAARETQLVERRGQMAKLLGGLVGLARVPRAALLVQPEVPVDALRGALLMRSAIPAIEAEADRLRSELAALAEIRATLAGHQAEAAAVEERLRAEIAGLDELAARREALLAETAAGRRAEEARLAALAADAGDLRDLIARLDADRRAHEAERQEAERRRAEAEAAAAAREAVERQIAALPKGGMVDGVLLPAGGDVVIRYGESDRFGAPSRGLTLEVREGAPIVAPLDGDVRFAGEFRGYGRILLLEHAGGYHSLISGLGRIDVAVGQQVLTGEPVGTVPQNGPNQPPFVYFEFRRQGQPVNPIEGLTQARKRGRG